MARKLILFGLIFTLLAFVFVTYVAVLRTDYKVTSTFVNISMVVLFSFLVLLIIRFFVLIYLSYLHHLDRSRTPDYLSEYLAHPEEMHLPSVSIIVPAYNEGVVIESSIRSLLNLQYSDLEVVVIDDGSKDDTFVRAKRYEGRHGRTVVKVFRQQNGGKGAALNFGIGLSTGEFVLTVDADSRLEPASLLYAVQHFKDPRVGAVAGNVKVGNRHTLITKMQALEYIEGLNMVRRSQGYFSAVNIIPGPMGLFRRTVLDEVGYYELDTFAEDCDITIKILIKGWKIEYEPFAITWTEAPETVRDFFRQRYRWTRGILQSLRKHFPSLFKGVGFVNTFMLWYMAFESLVWPLMNIFAQVYFLYVVIFFDLAKFVIFWWGQLTVLDIVVAMFCLSMERESMKLVPYSIVYRIYFVVLTDVCKVIASVEELLKIQMTWGKLDRTGVMGETPAKK
ncbi:MAG TPA: glycosyl transferase [Verrucomicrobia bacterium]|nr:glycosyl transferase [Verrucomicrobiota bacterium]